MHKDNTAMLEYIAWKLGVGYVNTGNHFSSYNLTKKNDLHKIFSIFDKYPLNTSKNLNYLMFKKGYELYYNSEDSMHNKISEIFNLINQMNKKRVYFKQPEGHRINITPYWLLGFVEGEGYFSVSLKTHRIEFGLGQTESEIDVIKAIREFILSLPGKFRITRSDTNVCILSIDKKAKNENSKPMAKIAIHKTDFIKNVLVPFFDNLTWLSNKKLDYEDWKLILNIKIQGKHFTDEGKELISLISKGMNLNRLSTSVVKGVSRGPLFQERVSNLLSSPSNFELCPDGKILVKSSGVYLKGRGNVGVKALNENNEMIYQFNSIKGCALFFSVSERTINRRLDSGSALEFNGNKLVLKREISLP